MSGGAEKATPLRAFEAVGVEIEYMIVDAESLDVRPLADRLIEAVHGEVENEIERGDVAWSNELVAHVVELKTNGPAPDLAPLAERFAAEVRAIDGVLERFGARLLPTGMHPWMDPERETRLWPHGDRTIYETFDRIFGCRGHGWANLQSVHVNLPFGDDDEFGRLHAAIRAALPLLPALAASSPFVEGRHRGAKDARLEAYRTNAARVPSVTGAVVPEPVYSELAYRGLLDSIHADLAPLDPEGVLRHEWVNARGAIARFERNAIEIRVLDVQECPSADLAVVHGTWGLVRMLAGSDFFEKIAHLDTERLAALLRRTSTAGSEAVLDDPEYAAALDLPPRCRAGDALGELLERAGALSGERGDGATLRRLLRRGDLASALLRRLGDAPSRARLRGVYAELADCLHENVLYDAAG